MQINPGSSPQFSVLHATVYCPETQNSRKWFRPNARIDGKVLPRCNIVRRVSEPKSAQIRGPLRIADPPRARLTRVCRRWQFPNDAARCCSVRSGDLCAVALPRKRYESRVLRPPDQVYAPNGSASGAGWSTTGRLYFKRAQILSGSKAPGGESAKPASVQICTASEAADWANR